MRAYRQPLGILTGTAAIVAIATSVASAAEVQITGAKLQIAESEVRLLLETAGSGSAPEVFILPKSGNRLEATISNSQLYLEEGIDRLRQDNPIPGIASIEMWQGASDTVFISVMGSDREPEGGVLQQEPGELILGFTAGNTEFFGLQRQNDAVSEPVAQSPVLERTDILPPNTVLSSQNIPPQTTAQQSQEVSSPYFQEQYSPEYAVAADSPQTTATPEIATPATTAIAPPAANPQSSYPPYDPNTLRGLLAQGATPIPPNAQIVPEGNPAPLAQPSQPIVPVPPLLPQPVPPPVSPQAVANVNVSQQILDLGTSARVPRIVLQDAPARDVLSLLARAADLNLIFAENLEDTQIQSEEGGPTISLDLQDEPIQDVFNNVIQATGLEATRRGRTIFVGVRLPETARDVISRTFRLNQVTANAAASFLSSLGAETQVPGTQTQIQTIGEGVNQEFVRTDRPVIFGLRAEDSTSGVLPLRGLSIAPDDRLNSITVIGEPVLVAMAGSYLTQLDARLRQVAINLKIIDVNLTNIGRFGSSFSWGIGDTGIVSNNGIGIVNFGTDDANIPLLQDDTGAVATEDFQRDRGETSPADAVTTFEGVGVNNTTIPFRPPINSGTFDIVNAFLAQLQFSIQNNNAKILTDPTLIVQEQQTASVNLTQEVISNVETTRDATGNTVTTSINVEKSEVGLVLQLAVNRIDDNGFIVLAVNPTVSTIGQNTTVGAGDDSQQIALLNTRSLSSGQIRIRDGQTLILSGIIQEQDRQQMQKIPLLGDIPIIGSLFRRTIRDNQRAEVIIIVTPRILDDSQNANFGYSYTPGQETRRLMEEQGFPALPPR
ncbi:MAG: secretin N-terminal domain-containing protein [Cyanobacteria bacterium P01_E01_bin.42]